jgi:hypothetical protein
MTKLPECRDCWQFDLRPRQENPECCDLCHQGINGHNLTQVHDYRRVPKWKVCAPVAERLRAMGYVCDEIAEAHLPTAVPPTELGEALEGAAASFDTALRATQDAVMAQDTGTEESNGEG